MEKKYQYKGHQPNANKNATHFIYPCKLQRDGIAKVNNYSLLIRIQPTHQIHDMDKKPQVSDEEF
jgi:hypothetical protein